MSKKTFISLEFLYVPAILVVAIIILMYGWSRIPESPRNNKKKDVIYTKDKLIVLKVKNKIFHINPLQVQLIMKNKKGDVDVIFDNRVIETNLDLDVVLESYKKAKQTE